MLLTRRCCCLLLTPLPPPLLLPAQAVAGRTQLIDFDTKSANFTLVFDVDPSVRAPTDIYVSEVRVVRACMRVVPACKKLSCICVCACEFAFARYAAPPCACVSALSSLRVTRARRPSGTRTASPSPSLPTSSRKLPLRPAASHHALTRPAPAASPAPTTQCCSRRRRPWRPARASPSASCRLRSS